MTKRQYVFLLALMVFASFLGGALSINILSRSGVVPDVIRSRCFEVVGQRGKVLAQLTSLPASVAVGENARGGGYLCMYDTNRWPSVELHAGKTAAVDRGPCLLLMLEGGDTRYVLLGDNPPRLTLSGAKRSVRIKTDGGMVDPPDLGLGDEYASINLGPPPTGKPEGAGPQIRLSACEKLASVRLRDRRAGTTAMIGTADRVLSEQITDTSPFVLLDKEGQVIFKAPRE
jgi:hypothetical protein